MILAHVMLPSGHLPLRWLRLPLLLATLGLSCVCIAVGAQALDRSGKLENRIREEATSTGSTIVFDMNDIKATTVVLTLVATLLALSSLGFSALLGVDWIRHLLRPRPGVAAKEEQHTTAEGGRAAVSTRTLGLQTAALAFLTAGLLAVLIPSTLFSRTGSARLAIVQPAGSTARVAVDPVYWDYGFLRCLAAAPWFSFIVSLPASIVTWVAWRYNLCIPTLEKA